MKLKNNIVSDSEMEITFDSFNPTAGRLADCLLGFSIQVQLTLVLALSRHTQGHTATTRPVLKCRGGATRRRRLGAGRCCLLRYSLDASIAWAEVQRSLDCGDDRSGSIRMAGLSYTVSSLVYLGPQFVLYLTKV